MQEKTWKLIQAEDEIVHKIEECEVVTRAFDDTIELANLTRKNFEKQCPSTHNIGVFTLFKFITEQILCESHSQIAKTRQVQQAIH